MRHQKKTKKLNRPTPHRSAMLANLATSLFKHRRIQTTDARAKELRRLADRIITLAKGAGLAAQRSVARIITDKATHKKLFTEIVPQLMDRTSGYTRVIKKGLRRGDASMISVVELLTPKPELSVEMAAKGAKTGSKPGAKVGGAPKKKSVSDKSADDSKKMSAPKKRAAKKVAPKTAKSAKTAK